MTTNSIFNFVATAASSSGKASFKVQVSEASSFSDTEQVTDSAGASSTDNGEEKSFGALLKSCGEDEKSEVEPSSDEKKEAQTQTQDVSATIIPEIEIQIPVIQVEILQASVDLQIPNLETPTDVSTETNAETDVENVKTEVSSSEASEVPVQQMEVEIVDSGDSVFQTAQSSEENLQANVEEISLSTTSTEVPDNSETKAKGTENEVSVNAEQGDSEPQATDDLPESSNTSTTNTESDSNVNSEASITSSSVQVNDTNTNTSSDNTEQSDSSETKLKKSESVRSNTSSQRKKYPNVLQGSEEGIEHKTLSHLKQDESAVFGTSYAQDKLMSRLMESWNEGKPELDSLVNERTGYSIADLNSVDQLRNNSWRNASLSGTGKTETTGKVWLKDVSDIIAKTLNAADLTLPKRIEIPLKTPEGSTIQLYLQEAGGHIRAQISTNDKLVLEWANRELTFLKEIPMGNQQVKWTPPQFEQREMPQDQSQQQHQPREQANQNARQQDENSPTFEEAIDFLETVEKEKEV